MINLKDETLRVLKENGKSENDIKWCGCTDFEIPIKLFWNLANEYYDNGYGGTEVADDLRVVGDNWWLERHEYDGSEWWEFKTIPVKPNEKKTINTVFCDYIGFLNEDKE